MDVTQLYNALNVVATTLASSGLKSAIEQYSTEMKTDDSLVAEKKLMHAANAYMNKASGYTEAELSVASSLQVESLQSPSFWFDVCAPTLSLAVRASMLDTALNHLNSALVHNPKTLAVLGTAAGEVSPADDSTIICVRIHDAVDKASDPDRISRLIDGVDMIYRSCANLAGLPEDSLELRSISGNSHRTVTFSGHIEVSTAARRIISTLHQQASNKLTADSYSVDLIAEQLPFMHAMDELFRVGALEAEFANEIRDGVMAGAIMLLECGARIHHGA